RLVDGRLAPPKFLDLRQIGIHARDAMPQIGQTCARDRTDIPRSNDCNSHIGSGSKFTSSGGASAPPPGFRPARPARSDRNPVRSKAFRLTWPLRRCLAKSNPIVSE